MVRLQSISRFSPILCLSILLSGSPTSCQDLETQMTVDVTNVTALVYNPPLSNSMWNVSSYSESLNEVSTGNLSGSVDYQFRGTSVTFFADPSNFDANTIVVSVDSQSTIVDTRPLLTLIDNIGLFTLLNTSGLSSTDLHTITVQKDSSTLGTWNLVKIKFTPPDSSSTSTPNVVVPTITNHSTSIETREIIAGAVTSGLIISLFASYFLYRRHQNQSNVSLIRLLREKRLRNVGVREVNSPTSFHPVEVALGHVRPFPLPPSQKVKGGKSLKNIKRKGPQENSKGPPSVRDEVQAQTKLIDLQIQDAQVSMDVLRLRSASSTAATAATTASSIADQIQNEGPNTSIETPQRLEPNGDTMDDLRARLVAQEAELESLRLERARLQQIIDAMDNETLPEYASAFTTNRLV